MFAAIAEPSSALARQLAPLQAGLSPWLWLGVGLAGLLAAFFARRRLPVAAALTAAAALLGLAMVLDIDRDRRVGWEQDRFQRLSTLRADELYYYLPDPSRVRLAACGNSNIAADFMYFRSLFFIYETTDTRGSGDLIYRMYDVIQDLNPRWKEPQLTGPVLVSALSGEDRQLRDNRIDQAGRLLRRSQTEFPDDFRFLDLEANLFWGAAADAAEDQRNARQMIDLYGRILERYPDFYRLHPDRNPFLEYATQPVRDRIAELAEAWWRPRFPRYDRLAPPPDLSAADREVLVAYWQTQRAQADTGVQTALAAAEAMWNNYRDSRRDLRDRLLMSLNAPDYRAELAERALAFCEVLAHELQNPLLDERDRPGKVLDYLRWTDVFRQAGYELQIDGFQRQFERLPTRAEFEQMAWRLQREPGDPSELPPMPQPPPSPRDPCGWAYAYEIDSSGRQFRVRSHFAGVYRAALKANRLLTLLDQTRDRLGRAPTGLYEVQAYLKQKYPATGVLPPPILESFGADRDPVASPCGGRFDFKEGQLFVPADVQTWLTLKKVLDKRPFADLHRWTRPYAPPAPLDPAAPPPPADSPATMRPVAADRLTPYP